MSAVAVPASIAGPVDRVHFAEEQRRYRRKSWRFSLLAFFAVLTTGIPACIVVTPLVYAITLLIAYIVNAISPLSPSTWAALQRLRGNSARGRSDRRRRNRARHHSHRHRKRRAHCPR